MCWPKTLLRPFLGLRDSGRNLWLPTFGVATFGASIGHKVWSLTKQLFPGGVAEVEKGRKAVTTLADCNTKTSINISMSLIISFIIIIIIIIITTIVIIIGTTTITITITIMRKHASWHLHSLLSLVGSRLPASTHTTFAHLAKCKCHVSSFHKGTPMASSSRQSPNFLRFSQNHITTRCHMMSHGYISRIIFAYGFLLLVEEIPNNHLGYIYIKPCKWWEIYHINRLAGFFPSTVCHLSTSISLMNPLTLEISFRLRVIPGRQDLEGFTVV